MRWRRWLPLAIFSVLLIFNVALFGHTQRQRIGLAEVALRVLILERRVLGAPGPVPGVLRGEYDAHPSAQ